MADIEDNHARPVIPDSLGGTVNMESGANPDSSPNENEQHSTDSQQPTGRNDTNRNTGTNNNNANNNANRGNNHGRGNNLANFRERLFQVLFSRFAEIYSRVVPPPYRRFIEFFILIKAISCLLLLVYIHIAFTRVPVKCLEGIKNNWPRDGILRVEVIKNPNPSYSIEDSYNKETEEEIKQNHLISSFVTDLDLIFGAAVPVIDDDHDEDDQILAENSEAKKIQNVHGNSRGMNPMVKVHMSQSSLNQFWPFVKHKKQLDGNQTVTPIGFSSEFSKKDKLDDPKDDVDSKPKDEPRTLWSKDDFIVEYSLEYGFLRLSPSVRERLNITVKIVVLDPMKDTCFGGAFSKFVLDEFLGYDDILIESIKHLADGEESRGYIRNVVTGEHYRFVNMWVSGGGFLASAFVMLVFTLSVSMLLRYSHHQIFLFIVDLLQMLEFNNPISFPAASMLNVVLALVGMEAIMSEFFKDNSTAFYVIALIWLCDQFEATCCHTAITKRHWLRFFYLYHFAFYAYHDRFNGQYSSIALMTSWFFILHSMFYFFHHYELPATLQQAQVQQLGRVHTVNIVLPTVPPANNEGRANAEGDTNNNSPQRGQPNVNNNALPASVRQRVGNVLLRRMAEHFNNATINRRTGANIRINLRPFRDIIANRTNGGRQVINITADINQESTPTSNRTSEADTSRNENEISSMSAVDVSNSNPTSSTQLDLEIKRNSESAEMEGAVGFSQSDVNLNVESKSYHSESMDDKFCQNIDNNTQEGGSELDKPTICKHTNADLAVNSESSSQKSNPDNSDKSV